MYKFRHGTVFYSGSIPEIVTPQQPVGPSLVINLSGTNMPPDETPYLGNVSYNATLSSTFVLSNIGDSILDLYYSEVDDQDLMGIADPDLPNLNPGESCLLILTCQWASAVSPGTLLIGVNSNQGYVPGLNPDNYPNLHIYRLYPHVTVDAAPSAVSEMFLKVGPFTSDAYPTSVQYTHPGDGFWYEGLLLWMRTGTHTRTLIHDFGSVPVSAAFPLSTIDVTNIIRTNNSVIALSSLSGTQREFFFTAVSTEIYNAGTTVIHRETPYTMRSSVSGLSSGISLGQLPFSGVDPTVLFPQYGIYNKFLGNDIPGGPTQYTTIIVDDYTARTFTMSNDGPIPPPQDF